MTGASSHQRTMTRSRESGGLATSAGQSAVRPSRATHRSLSKPLLLLAAFMLTLWGCGAEETLPGLTGGGGGEGGSTGSGHLPVCEDGATRECHFALPDQGEVKNCFNGIETCDGGIWTPCANGKITSMGAPQPKQIDDESAEEERANGLPPENHPHSLSNPAMCNPITSCVHDWCSEGPALSAACDPCVAQICAISPACCAGAWDAACVDQVDTVCKLSCFRDPCNPSCQNFNEKPINGVVLPGDMIPPWENGSTASIFDNDVWALKGKKEPCVDANDCQFNTYCNLPVTNGSLHDKCAPGVALKNTAGADVCVDKICGLHPSCCSAGNGFCAHDKCVTGAPLFCLDLCVAFICIQNNFADAYCCGFGPPGSTWDENCVEKVGSVCGLNCNKWDNSCVDKVHSTCGAFCNTPPAAAPPAACEHDKCFTGSKLSAGCSDPCVAQVCAAFPNCCNVGWDASCTAAVSSVCGQACPVKGVCQNWLGGQTDPLCPNKPDLTLGIPCNTKIPICNVGGVAAVGTVANPIEVAIAPAGTNKMASCTKDPTANVCPPFIGSIAPGQCVTLDCPAWADGMGAEIVVNGNGAITECYSTPTKATCNEKVNSNNWTISGTPTTCEPPICTGSKASTPIRSLAMHIMVERSASSAPAAKWTGIVDGVGNYLSTTSAVGTPRAAVQFFPDGPPEAVPQAIPNPCTAAACIATPAASANCTVRNNPAGMGGDLRLKFVPNAAFALNVKAVPVGAGLAPTTFAYEGALNNIVAQSNVNYAGDRNIVLILTSDVTTCGGTIGSLAALAASAFQNKRTQTWVIAVGTVPGLFNQVAAAGNTGAEIHVASGDALAITNALKAIQATYTPCSFKLPPVNLFDSSAPVVEIKNADSSVFTTMDQVPGVGDCSAAFPPAPYQFYYDNNAVPTKIIYCPQTCQQIRTSGAPSFINKASKITLNCPGTFDDTVLYVQRYKSECPLGTKVQWGFLTYDSVEPPQTSTDIKIRVADDEAEFDTPAPPMDVGPPYYDLATATLGPPDTQQCLLVGGPAVCSIDLFAKLGGPPAAVYDNLELTFAMHTNVSKSQTPTMNSWQITYSCLDTD